jgi:DNA topoisomerase-3
MRNKISSGAGVKGIAARSQSPFTEERMGKALVIAEKPSVAKDIAAALGGVPRNGDWYENDDLVISNAFGHLVELHVPEAAPNGSVAGLDALPIIPQQFGSRPIAKTTVQFNLLTRLMRRPDVERVINACDAGREGELIFRRIYELAGCRKPMQRMWLQSMTTAAIRTAHQTMRSGKELDPLADAARSRSEADWVIGINGSRAITRLREIQTGHYEMATAGRVQTPTLAILVDLEEQIRKFVAQDYWEVHATFGAQAGIYVGKWTNPRTASPEAAEVEGEASEKARGAHRIFSKQQAQDIAAKCRGQVPSSVTETCTREVRHAPVLYDLTTLQREANKRYKFSAKKTLEIAQALYERHKATSYPRTDAKALPEDYLEQAITVLGTFAGTAYAAHAQRVLDHHWVKPSKRIFDNSKISDHFAIIPTGSRPASLTDDEAAIYDMIVRRFLAVLHPAAEYDATVRVTVVVDEAFRSTGRVLVSKGWMEVYGNATADAEQSSSLCAVDQAEQVQTQGVDVKSLKTKAPTRHTESTLLAAMETAGKLVEDEELREAMRERGLGTPATRAATIEGLLDDKGRDGDYKMPYATREGKEKYLTPTEKGMGLIGFLKGNGVEFLTSPRLTGEWEHKLLMMEKGQLPRATFMAEIAEKAHQMIDVIRHQAADPHLRHEPEISIPCPACRAAQLRSDSRAIACAANCGFRLWREIAGRRLSIDEATTLLTTGELHVLDGFFSTKKNKPFSAGLWMTPEHRAEFYFPN